MQKKYTHRELRFTETDEAELLREIGRSSVDPDAELAPDELEKKYKLTAKPLRSQAERVIEKFGGARRLAVLLKIVAPHKNWSPSAIYRWAYPKERGGRGGVIPATNILLIEQAARLDGIVLTSDDLLPGMR